MLLPTLGKACRSEVVVLGVLSVVDMVVAKDGAEWSIVFVHRDRVWIVKR
jgi:hypothetical protein